MVKNENEKMNAKSRQSGVTLTEMTAVVAVIALLVTFGLPAIRTLHSSFESGASVRAMISAGLASARAIAASQQHYAGIRFQKAYNPGDPEQLEASQYMIFIVHDFGRTGLANGFRAVEGLKPIKLPDSVGVMDLRYRTNNLDPRYSGDELIDEDGDITADVLRDTTAFSVIFSPSGKMVIHDVRIRNKDGETTDASNDDIFNTESNVTNTENPVGMFIQDDYGDLGLGQELSRNSFIIYDRKEFKQAYEKGQGYSDCLVELVPIYINPYTGTMISVD